MSTPGESQSVEQKQAEQSAPKAANPDLDPAAKRAEADRKRRIQALEMQREHVLSQRTSSPHRRTALELALASIEVELEQLGWSIKI